MKPGIYQTLSNEEYHAGPGISQSALSVVARSPLHYWARYVDPNREPSKQTDAMRLGTAIHMAVLEPAEFGRRYHAAPSVDRRTKEGKAEYQAASERAETEGAMLLPLDDAMTCLAIAQQVRKHPTARRLFADGRAEQSIYWTDRETGLLCRARPDWLTGRMMVDLKSTDDASLESFQRSAWNYRYWMQAAWYMDGWEEVTGERLDAFVFAAFEKSAPYACAFYFADEGMLDRGRQEYRKLLRIVADCQAANEWPGYPAEVRALGVPTWAITAAERAAQGEK